MRYLLLAILGVSLVTGGLFLQLGYKEVTRADCQQATGDEGNPVLVCNVARVEAVYWSDHLTVDLYSWREVDSTRTTNEVGVRELHDYQIGTNDELDGNAGLFWGRPVLIFSIGLTAFAFVGLALTRKRLDAARWAAVGTTVGAGAMLAIGSIMTLGGMVIHSGTWAGVVVSNLVPRLGFFVLGPGALMGVYGIVRHAQIQANRLRGLSGNSPLAPILEIGEPEQKLDARGKRVKEPLVFSRDIFIALLAAFLIAASTPLPLAYKDMTIHDCQQRQGEWECERFDMQVTYRTFGAIFLGQNGTTDPRYHDIIRNFDGPMSSGSFTDFYPGNALLGWAYPLWLLGAGATALMGIGQIWRRRWGLGRAPWINVGFTTLIVALVATGAGALVLQSWSWPGSPAGHLRPAFGLIIPTIAFGIITWFLIRSFKIAKAAKGEPPANAPATTAEDKPADKTPARVTATKRPKAPESTTKTRESN